MEMKLYERRTKTRILSDQKENQCYLCKSYNTIVQLEPLKPNIHQIVDKRGNQMMEQRVKCMKCNAECVDVFCRMYPDVSN